MYVGRYRRISGGLSEWTREGMLLALSCLGT